MHSFQYPFNLRWKYLFWKKNIKCIVAYVYQRIPSQLLFLPEQICNVPIFGQTSIDFHKFQKRVVRAKLDIYISIAALSWSNMLLKK
jgi:hypothetical protein